MTVYVWGDPLFKHWTGNDLVFRWGCYADLETSIHFETDNLGKEQEWTTGFSSAVLY
jgi:hypothetical protein